MKRNASKNKKQENFMKRKARKNKKKKKQENFMKRNARKNKTWKKLKKKKKKKKKKWILKVALRPSGVLLVC